MSAGQVFVEPVVFFKNILPVGLSHAELWGNDVRFLTRVSHLCRITQQVW